MNNNKSIFQTEKLWKLSLKVVLPSLIVTLLFGIYIFVDQVLMQQIVPNNGVNFFYNGFLSKNYSDTELINVLKVLYPYKDSSGNIINSFYDQDGNIILNDALLQSNKDVIFLSVTTIGTINLLFISIGFFINTGASVIYSRTLAKNNYQQAKEVWISSFYSCIIASVIILALMLGIQKLVIELTIPSASDAAQGSNYDILLKYYQLRNDAALEYANHYTFFITISIPVIMILNLLIFFVRAEGKNLYITVAGVASNLINIIFDIIFFMLLKLNIVGGGISTFIGYIFNISMLIGYVIYLSRKNIINFAFKDLVRFKIKANYLISSFLLSLGNFLRDLALAIANILYIPVFSATMGKLISMNIISESYLSDIFAVSASPIYNLFFFSMQGIIDGMRPIIAYNYEQKNYKRVKDACYSGLLVGFLYAILVNIILFSSLNDNVLSFFNAGTQSRKEVLIMLFYTMMFQLPFLSLSLSGISLFQSNGKMLMTLFLSLFQGLICFIPVLYGMSNIAIAVGNEKVMLFTGFTNIALSSVIIEIITTTYLYFYMGKKEKSCDPLNQVDKVINFVDNKILKKNVNANIN